MPGIDQFHFEGPVPSNKLVTVIAGEKGWWRIGDRTTALSKEALADEKRKVYLQVVPITLVQLKGKDFKLEVAREEKGDGKPAAGLKVTGPDKKDFTLYFDKDSGLPVR